MKRFRLLMVSPELPPKVGGIGQSTIRMAEGFGRTGIDVLVVAYLRDRNIHIPPTVEYDSESYPFRLMKVGPMRASGQNIGRTVMAQLNRMFIETAIDSVEKEGFYPDLVMTMTVNIMGFLGTSIANYFNVPHLVSARGLDIGAGIFRPDYLPFSRFALEKSDRVTFVNGYLHRIASMVFGRQSKFSVVHNGIFAPPQHLLDNRTAIREHLRRELGFAPDDFVVGYSGTFREKKGIRYMEDAFIHLKQQRPNAKLLVVGGPRKENERKMAAKLFDGGSHSWSVFSTGLLNDREAVLSYYMAMDCALVPSIEDGLPNAMLEAMVMGLPVVATDMFRDVIWHGHDGLLVPRYDGVALAEACMQIHDDKALAAQLGKNAGVAAATRFSAERETNDYLVLFDELVNSEPVTPHLNSHHTETLNQ
ncbi:MAG: glycosyltransferase family 4 protein [Ardenticatenaceae bacterium]